MKIKPYIDQYLWGHPDDSYWSIIMPIFSARNGHETKLLIYFQERKIREKLLPNEGMMMKVLGEADPGVERCLGRLRDG